MYRYLETSTEGNAARLWLNRPEKRNAFTPGMVAELAHCLATWQADDAIFWIEIHARGPVFCSGMDLLVFENPALEDPNPEVPEFTGSLALAMRQTSKPTLAVVEGPVLAGGFLIVGECTLVITRAEATFGLPEVNRGIFPFQVMETLRRRMSDAAILRWCLLAETVTAHEAERRGLVTHVAEAGELVEMIEQIRSRWQQQAPLAMRSGIEALRALDSIPEADRLGWLKGQLEELKASQDAQEGLAAFREKRTPVWRNR